MDRYIDLSETLYGDPILWGLYYGDLISIIETTLWKANIMKTILWKPNYGDYRLWRPNIMMT